MYNSYNDVDILQSIVIAVFLYMGGVIYVFFNKDGNRTLGIKIFSLAFLLRFISLYGIYYYLIYIGGDGFVIKDYRQYDVVAKLISHELNKGLDGYRQYGSGWKNIAYFNFNGWLYYYFNFDTLSSRMVNAFL